MSELSRVLALSHPMPPRSMPTPRGIMPTPPAPPPSALAEKVMIDGSTLASHHIHDFSSTQKFTFEVANNSRMTFDGGRLVMLRSNTKQTSVEVPRIEKYERATVKLDAEPIVGLDIISIKADTTVVLQDSTGREVDRSTYTYDMRFFANILKGKMPAAQSGLDKYNILFFGPAGSAKSSTLNTSLTLMQTEGDFSERKKIVTRAVVGGGSGHTTDEIRETPLTETVSLWDTFGLEERTFQGKELQLIFKGLIASGWKMKRFQELHKHAADILKAKPTAEQRAPAACLFLVPASCLALDDDPMLTSLGAFFKIIQGFNIQPIVLITLADEQCPELRQNAMGVFPRVEEMRKKVAESLRIPINSVFVPVNYTSETERDWNIDRNMYRILEAAIRAASQKVAADLVDMDKPEGDGGLNFGSYTPRSRPSSARRSSASSPDSAVPVAVGTALPSCAAAQPEGQPVVERCEAVASAADVAALADILRSL